MTGRHLNIYTLKKHITRLKRLKKYSCWNNLGSQAVQDVIIRIEKAYQLFSKSLKKPDSRKVSPPGFKNRCKYRSFTLTQAGYEVLPQGRIRLGDRIYRYHDSRAIVGVIKTLTVKRDALRDLYLVFSCDGAPLDAPNRAMTGKSAGVDFGLKKYLTLSSGEAVEAPLPFKRSLRRIKRSSKAVSRKKKGSHNRSRAAKNLARAYKKIGNQRLDFNMKLARRLALTYDYLFFEDLDIDSMKRLWGRKVSDMGFADYLRMQEYMCIRFGSSLELIDRFCPSSKTCHSCGYVNVNLSLRDRFWHCPSCDATHDRDRNASQVIHMVGASNHWERSYKTAGTAGSIFASIPEFHMF